MLGEGHLGFWTHGVRGARWRSLAGLSQGAGRGGAGARGLPREPGLVGTPLGREIHNWRLDSASRARNEAQDKEPAGPRPRLDSGPAYSVEDLPCLSFLI